MIKRFSSLLKKEINLGLKNFFLPISLLIVVIGILLYHFVVPEEVETNFDMYINLPSAITDIAGEDTINDFLDENEIDKDFILNSKEDVFEAVEDNKNSIGVIIEIENNEPIIEFVLQGNEPEEFINLMELSITSGIYELVSDEAKYDTVEIGDVNKLELSNKDMVVPVFLLMEPAIMGLFTIAMLMFFEKEQDTQKLLLSTPASLGESLAAKAGFQVLFSTILGSIFIVATVGFSGNTLQAIIILMSAGFFFAAIGLLVASFVENMNQAFGLIIAIVFILMAPIIFFVLPGSTPDIISFIPSNWALTSLVEALFGNGEWSVVLRTVGMYIVGGIVVFFLGVKNLKRKLARG